MPRTLARFLSAGQETTGDLRVETNDLESTSSCIAEHERLWSALRADELLEVPQCELERLLPPSAVRLLHVGLAEAVASKTPDGWWNVALRELAKRAQLSYSGAKKALGFLRRIGLVVTERIVIKRYVGTTAADRELLGKYKATKLVNALDENCYNFLGALVHRGREVVISLHRRAWQAFVALAPKTKRSDLPRTYATPPAWAHSFSWEPNDSADVDSGPSIDPKNKSKKVERSESKISASRDRPFLAEAEPKPVDEDTIRLAEFLGGLRDAEPVEGPAMSLDQLLGCEVTERVRPTPRSSLFFCVNA